MDVTRFLPVWRPRKNTTQVREWFTDAQSRFGYFEFSQVPFEITRPHFEHTDNLAHLTSIFDVSKEDDVVCEIAHSFFGGPKLSSDGVNFVDEQS